MKIDNEAKILILIIFFIISTAIFLRGIDNGYKNKCDYVNIISRITIPYVIGCELGKPRFK